MKMQLPKYTKMKLAVLNWIAQNGLQSGDRLPPEREIMDIFSLSRNTVRHALAELVEAGYLERLPQSGYYLRKPIAAVEQHEVNIGYLMAGRAERWPAGVSRNSLYHAIPFQEMKSRGIEMIARYEEKPDSRLFQYFSSCAGLLLTDWVTDEWVNTVKELHIPMCCIGSTLCRREKIPAVDYDYEYMTREQVKKLHEHGCRKMVLLLCNCEMPSAHKTEKAYRETIQGYGIPVEERRIVKVRYGHEDEDMMEGLMRNDDCDAVISYKLPDIFEYRQLNWKHDPLFALQSSFTPSLHRNLRAVFPYFPQDIYLEAANLLLDHILLDKAMPQETLLKPEIHDQIMK